MPRSGPGDVTSLPRILIVPLSGAISPAMAEMSVVLPEPENPTMAMNSPSATERSMPVSTSVRVAPSP
jgi:hypothetical protein